MAANRTRHGSALRSRTARGLFHVTILTNRALQDFSRQILLRHVFHLVEMAGGALLGAAEQRHLLRLMDKVLLRIGVRTMHGLARLDLERGRRPIGTFLD